MCTLLLKFTSTLFVWFVVFVLNWLVYQTTHNKTGHSGYYNIAMTAEGLMASVHIIDIIFSFQKPHPLVSSKFQEYLKTKDGMFSA